MTTERTLRVLNGWMMLWVNLLLIVGGTAATFWCAMMAKQVSRSYAGGLWVTIPAIIIGAVSCRGLFTLEPNSACALLLLGAYRGTVHESGFFWTNPFMTRLKISLRVRNLETNRLKVNDK